MKICKPLVFMIIPVLMCCGTARAENTRTQAKIDIAKKGSCPGPLSFRELMARAEKDLQKVNNRIQDLERNEEARKLFAEGNELYQTGDIWQADKKWQKVLELSGDPSLIKKTRRARTRVRQRQREIERQIRDEQRQPLLSERRSQRSKN